MPVVRKGNDACRNDARCLLGKAEEHPEIPARSATVQAAHLHTFKDDTEGPLANLLADLVVYADDVAGARRVAAAGEVSARVGRDHMGRGHGGYRWPGVSDEWAEGRSVKRG